MFLIVKYINFIILPLQQFATKLKRASVWIASEVGL